MSTTLTVVFLSFHAVFFFGLVVMFLDGVSLRRKVKRWVLEHCALKKEHVRMGEALILMDKTWSKRFDKNMTRFLRNKETRNEVDQVGNKNP